MIEMLILSKKKPWEGWMGDRKATRWERDEIIYSLADVYQYTLIVFVLRGYNSAFLRLCYFFFFFL